VVCFENKNNIFYLPDKSEIRNLAPFFFSTGDVHLVEFDSVVNLLS